MKTQEKKSKAEMIVIISSCHYRGGEWHANMTCIGFCLSNDIEIAATYRFVFVLGRLADWQREKVSILSWIKMVEALKSKEISCFLCLN